MHVYGCAFRGHLLIFAGSCVLEPIIGPVAYDGEKKRKRLFRNRKTLLRLDGLESWGRPETINSIGHKSAESLCVTYIAPM